MKINKVREILKEQLSPELYQHSSGVESIAVKLAAAFGANKKKAALAALLHDYGKKYSFEILLKFAVKYKIADHLSLQDPILLHAPVGAWLIKKEWGINDKEILEAVKRHTTGFQGMSLLSRIIYLADYIEPGRSCPGANSIRKIAFHDLGAALLGITELTISYVLERGKILHPDSVAFRNSLILEQRKEKTGVLNDEAKKN